MTNLITLYSQSLKPAAQNTVQDAKPVSPAPVSQIAADPSLLPAYLSNQAVLNSVAVKPVKTADNDKLVYRNDLRNSFQNNQVKMLAIIPRTFNAKDQNGDAIITDGEQSGTFLNAIERLDEVKNLGFNALHVLPIHPPGKKKAMGTAGSIYSPLDLLGIDPVLDDKNDPRDVKEEFREFVNQCHKRGIKVMLDLPSCSSFDLFEKEPDLMAKERDGLAKTPQGWNDIRMFQPWADEGKRTLNPKLLELHKKYVDMCIDCGVDGIRADVARAKPVEFWNIIIPYSRTKDPQFAWLAESYTYEDASPQANMPYDRPEDSLRAGFDSYYGQFHIFHEWGKASDLTNYIKENLELSYKLDKGKSLIGSFATHDDISPMFHGGVDYCNLTTGIQATLPMTNPYAVDGFQSGDYYIYPYEDKYSEKTMTDNHQMNAHKGKLDIFNLSRRPGGNNPEVGSFMAKTFAMRDKYADLIGKGTFIELDKTGDKGDQVIAYARHLNGKTLLVLANKNIDRNASATITIPTLKENQQLVNLLPNYGKSSILQAGNNELRVDLGPARVHVFEIDTPDIEKNTNKVYKQNL